VKLSIEVVESNIEDLLATEDADQVHRAVSRYAREVAFATAEVYARAAEVRGAWDARLEALVVDAVLRAETDEAVLSRASALGWKARGTCAWCSAPRRKRRTETDLFDEVRRTAGADGMDALCAVQGDRLVVLLGGRRRAAPGGVGDRRPVRARPGGGRPGRERPGRGSRLRPRRPCRRTAPPRAGRTHRARCWPPSCWRSARWAATATRAGSWSTTSTSRSCTRGARSSRTLSAWLDRGSSIEGAARALFVHPNTVRYRLRQVADLTGLTPGQPRDAFTLQIALVLGRQSGRASEPAHEPHPHSVDVASDTG
jgi:hypothetical protein